MQPCTVCTRTVYEPTCARIRHVYKVYTGMYENGICSAGNRLPGHCGCVGVPSNTPPNTPICCTYRNHHTMSTLYLRSPAFNHEGSIPLKYTCDGENISPPLAIDGVPEGTISLVLTMDDHDVPPSVRPDGVWDHWVVFNIPPTVYRIPEDAPPMGIPGSTTNGTTTYEGPCPPNGEHRYLFKVYALDTLLDVPEGSNKQAVLDALQGHILESTTLMGRYKRVPVHPYQ
jgi:Raf kinase inhibitor-like YbhB/YbcL family protein